MISKKTFYVEANKQANLSDIKSQSFWSIEKSTINQNPGTQIRDKCTQSMYSRGLFLMKCTILNISEIY